MDVGPNITRQKIWCTRYTPEIPENPSEATINLMAPIVINERERCGKQVILHESQYSVKHPLLHVDGQDKVEAQGA